MLTKSVHKCRDCGAAGPFYSRGSTYCKSCQSRRGEVRRKEREAAESPEQRRQRLERARQRRLKRLATESAKERERGKQRERSRRHHGRHRNEINAKARASYNPERSRRYYEANRDRLIPAVKARREADIEAAKRRERATYLRTKAKRTAEKVARLRSMEKACPDTIAYDAILRGDPCAYCGECTHTRWVDHIEPVANGGRNHWTNLTAACQPCNRRKSAHPLLVALLEV